MPSNNEKFEVGNPIDSTKSLLRAKLGKKFKGIRQTLKNKIAKNNQLEELTISKQKTLFKRIRHFKNKPWAKDLYMNLLSGLENVNGDISKLAFKYAKDFKDVPWAKNLLKLAATNASWDAWDYLKNYKDRPWAYEVLVIAAKQRPLHAYFEIKKYKDIKKADEILSAAIDKSAYMSFSIFKECKNKKWAEKIAIKAAKHKDYANAFEYVKDFKNMPWAEKVLKIYITTHKGYGALGAVKDYKNMPWAKSLTLFALKFDRAGAFQNPEGWGNLPWAEEIALKAVEKDNKDFWMMITDLKKYKWTEKISLIAAKKDPLGAYLHIKDYINEKYAKKILKIATKKESIWAFRFYKKYQSKPWANEILTIAFNNLETFKDRIFAEEHLKKLDKLKIDNQKKSAIKKQIKESINLADTILAQTNISRDIIEDLHKHSKPSIHRKRLSLDPGLQKVFTIKDSWIIPPPTYRLALVQYKIMISRNLYVSGKKINQVNVLREYKKLLTLRKKHKKTPIFKNRNVLYVAHNEKTKAKKGLPKHLIGTNTFGKKPVLDAIKAQCGASKFKLIRSPKNIKEQLKVKKQILEHVENIAPPFNFTFNGHGDRKGLYLSKGEIKKGEINKLNAVYIHYKELGDALKKRAKKYPNEKPPIIVITTCFGQTFMRNLYKYLGEYKPLPISLTSAEYNQYGISRPYSKYGSRFFRDVLDLSKTKTTTLGTVMKNEFKGDTNPTLYIPDEKGKLQQISKLKNSKKQKQV